MYFQFLVEDYSTKILASLIMAKIQKQYMEKEIFYDIKSFKGIGHLPKKGTVIERKTGQLLNDLPLYLRAFDRKMCCMGQTALIIIMDNDTREPVKFREQLEDIARMNMVLVDHVFCIAVKEMEAWLLGDIQAVEKAYPDVRKNYMRDYEQDAICETWEVLANMVYPGGINKLKKQAANSYMEIGRAKSEWAEKIGRELQLNQNLSPSFNFFIRELEKRIQ